MMLEEANRGVQHWIPAVPHDEDWYGACANYTRLRNLRESVLKDVNIKDPKTKTAKPVVDIKDQVRAVRRLVREREYLLHPETPEAQGLLALNGAALDSDLDQLVKGANEKRSIYVDAFINHLKSGSSGSVPFKECVLFVTPEERAAYNSIENKTIAEILHQIELKLADIQDPELKASLDSEFKDEFVKPRGKKPLKQAYLDFYAILEECIVLQEDQDELLDSNSGDESD